MSCEIPRMVPEQRKSSISTGCQERSCSKLSLWVPMWSAQCQQARGHLRSMVKAAPRCLQGKMGPSFRIFNKHLYLGVRNTHV